MKQLVTLMSVLVLLGSCAKEDPVNLQMVIPADKATTNPFLRSFPMKAGNEWIYTVSEQTTRVTTGAPIYSEVSTYEVRIKVLYDTTLTNGVKAYKTEVSGPAMLGTSFLRPLDEVYHSQSFYVMNDTGNKFPAGVFSLNLDMPNDSLHLFDTSVMVLKFPAMKEQRWTNHEYQNFVYRRDWLDYVQVATPAGTFNCVKMRAEDHVFNYVPENMPTAVQYYSSKGLIKSVDSYVTTDSVKTGPITRTIYALLKSTNF